MNQNIKNAVWVAVGLAVLAVGYAALSYANSFGKSIQPSSFRSFSVSGEGKVVAIPDVAEFSFTVTTEGGTDVASLQTTNTDKVNKAIDFVKSQGVADKDIKTSYYNINPRYQTYQCQNPIVYGSNGSAPSVQPCPPASIVGYTVTQSVDVKVRDFSKTGAIMSGVVTNGANQIGALSFSIDDPTKVRSEARAQAIAKARAEAQNIAQAGGFSVGRLLGVSEGYNPYPVYNSFSMAAGLGGAKADAAVPAPAIQPGSQEVDVTVSMQYEIN
ncbi:MAG: SIMPL domain-containing protein [Patescibacteria group bacterium]|nr:SIMPL domain-containing protein [Patescibacteria group bacterium]MDE2015659.1 SIMPL domain-containing protein [Patescibacteria group bacterium]MDE2226716.1 SIMPL domain-containing protein [Patescibacteria group bacterium]